MSTLTPKSADTLTGKRTRRERLQNESYAEGSLTGSTRKTLTPCNALKILIYYAPDAGKVSTRLV